MNIYCVEQNYFTNKREIEGYIYSDPAIFIKPETALLPPGSSLNYHGFEDHRLYSQRELVLRISKNGKDIPESQAINYYNSVTTGINFIQMDIHDVLNALIVPWEKVNAWLWRMVGESVKYSVASPSSMRTSSSFHPVRRW